MPDALLLLGALAAAAVAAFVAKVAIGRTPRTRRDLSFALGSPIGFVCGVALGLWLLGVRCHWPPREDQDRLLLVLLPLAVLTDIVGAWPRLRPAALVLRIAVCAACGPVILWGSIHVSDAAGPGSRLLSTPTIILLGAAAAALMASAWRLLLHAQPALPRPAIGIALAMTLAAASAATLLSGYASAGLTGLILQAAFVGTSVGITLLPAEAAQPPLAIPLVALAAVLLQGHFFGELNSVFAMALWITPLLASVIALVAMRGRRPWMKCAVLWLLVALASGAIVSRTYLKFTRDAVEGYAHRTSIGR